MTTLLHQILENSTIKESNAVAVTHKKSNWTYQQLYNNVRSMAQAFISKNLGYQQRVAIYLPKQIETVVSFFAISQAAGVFVPINPVLKPPQVKHILNDCNVHVLITAKNRLLSLSTILGLCPDLHTIILVDNELPEKNAYPHIQIFNWDSFLQLANDQLLPSIIDTNMAAILYTSGSTGNPKGVVLSHHNLVAGAQSVAQYLNITSDDKLLAVLPFSFDYGLNQLISAILQGAECVLLDYLLPRDVIKALEKHQITGLAAVPPLWAQLSTLKWPKTINHHLRYMTNSGGKMPKAILDSLCQKVSRSQFYLMYGLTEAFRSTYLPPEQIKHRPDSIGKAIPNAEVLVVREDGSLCAPHEPGELVHRGSLVAMGYWNDPKKTAERFKPAPNKIQGLPLDEIAVWSGDQVSIDEEGYLYFVGRKDDMLKTSGYRVSPTEIEEIIYSSGFVKEVAAIGIPHDTLGHTIIVIITAENKDTFIETELIKLCKTQLPNFMVPARIIALDELPKNPNGKIDKNFLISQFSGLIE